MPHEAGLTWLHISDIHFRQESQWRDNPARRSLLDFLRTQLTSERLPKPDLIFCTGDIAFGESTNAALAQQYGYANYFFDALLQVCGSLPRDRLFVVPGNHDVNRSKVNKDAQSALGHKSKESHLHEEEINQRFESAGLEHQQALERLADYGLFIQERLAHQSNPERHVYAKVIDVGGRKIGVGGFNSAWSCAGPEDDRQLWLAAQWQFNHVQQLLEPAQLRIGLIHHPIDWLNETERDVSTRRIAGNFHFWLHGHMHNAWVSPGPNCTTVAAGAVGAATPDEFGINLVSLDFAKNIGKVHLLGYSARDNGWTSKPVAHHAPDGVWHLSIPNLPEFVASPETSCAKLAETAPVVQSNGTEALSPLVPALPPARVKRLYGRENLIADLLEKSKSKNVLVLYGLRGNGKSELIDALLKQASFAARAQSLRIPVYPEYGVNAFFRQLATSLGDTAEQPRLPQGSRDEMAAALQRKYPNAAPTNIWIDKAHLWIDERGWRNPELERLFHAVCIAFSGRLFWFFELRERPSKPGLFGSTAYEKEVPGLDKTSLAECLKDAAPTGQEAAWAYNANQLTQLYQWLGGGHRQQAHPLAIQLLIEVARGRQRTPLDALQQLPLEAEQRIEDALLGDLYSAVLSQSEQTLLQALALYRQPIPHDHADELEQQLQVPQAWDGLYRRCLLPSDGDGAYFYLHGFIASWVRHQMGYESDADTLTPAPSSIDISVPSEARLQKLHGVVAACWLKQLGTTKRISQINIERALEAFHHLLCAGQADGIQNIAIELLGKNLQWVHQRLWQYDDDLRARSAPIAEQRNVLDYITQLDPEDHKAWRFLGECWGQQSSEALRCFRNAHELNPGFPQYLANLGKALIRQGAAGATEFLDRLNTVRQTHPEAVNEYVIAIQAHALATAGSGPAASALRQTQIDQGTRNPVFYNAEAEYQLSLGQHAEANRLLDLAKQRGCADSYTESIRAKVLEAQGDGPAASALRQTQIDQGTRDAAFYNAEAEYQLSLGQHAEANRLLDLAKQRGCADSYTESIRAKVARAIGYAREQHEVGSLKQKPLVYISYAWGGDSDRAVDGLQVQLESFADVRRDRTAMQAGDSIRAFEQEIGRGACVLVVLSAKYMRSPDCMRELGYLWERSQRNGATFSQRVIPVVLEDARIGKQVDRIEHVRFWQEEKGRLEALVNQLGPALCGQSTTQALQDIHAFQAQLVDALTWLADQVMPRGFAALNMANYAPVVDLIKKRLR